jgi:3-phenylpropionate/trans-cinnamate dioxygenase ferredoxin component
MRWFKVCRIEDLKPGEAHSISILARPYAVFNVNGKYYGLEAACRHMKANLAAGRLCGEIVECVMHGWEYNVTTGESLTVPDDSLQTFPVKTEDGFIWIGLDWPDE